VFSDPDLQESGRQDVLRWVEQAGWNAGRVAETLHEWDQARAVYDRLAALFPALGDMARKRLDKADKSQHPVAAKVQPAI